MKKVVSKALITLGILLSGMLLGYIALVMTFFIGIPEEKYIQTMAILDGEGFHPRDAIRTPKTDYFHEKYPDILDFGTDELIVKYSMENPSEPIYKHALIKEYYRYWHGYILALRPLFRVLDLSEIRILNGVVQFLLCFILLFLLYRNTQKINYSLAYATVLAFLIPSATSVNFQYSMIYYASVIPSIVLLCFRKFWHKNGNYFFFFVLAGMFTTYIDLLTYPLLAWAFSAVILLITANDNTDYTLSNCMKNIKRVFISAAAWIIGYIGFWSEKWLLGTILTDVNVFKDAQIEILLRIGASGGSSILDRLKAIVVNYQHLAYLPFVIALLVWFVYWIIVFTKRGFALDSRIPALSIMILSAPVWYILANEHSIGHHLYTWKNTLSTVLAALMIVCLSTNSMQEPIKRLFSKGLIKRIVILLVCLSMSLATYWLLPIEETSFNNYALSGGDEGTVISAGDKDAYEYLFTPRYGYIKSFDPLFECEDSEGYLEIIVEENGKVKYVEKIYKDDCSGIIAHKKVKWHLKKGRQYKIRVSTEHLNNDVKIWITDMLDKYENAGNDNALITEITYHAPFNSKVSAIYYIMEWLTVYLIIFYIVLSIKKIGIKSSFFENNEVRTE